MSTDPTRAAPLIDAFGRRIDYLRVSVTDRCDLRCTYCLPKGFTGFEEPAHWMSHAQMLRLVGLFVGLGVRKVRLTGGEPLLRRGLTGFAAGVAALPGVADLALSTNATQLADHAAALHAAGVTRLNVSLDSLDRDCFARITGRDCLAQVLQGLHVARRAGFAPIKLNMVVQAGVNEVDVERMVAFSLAHGFVLRLIEPMPMGDTGRAAGLVDVTALGRTLAQRFGLIPQLPGGDAGPARYWTDAAGRMSLGAITPLSRHFCATCNRVRLTVDGTLHLCLGQEDQVPLGAMLRAGASDTELVAAIRCGIAAKPERHEFDTRPQKIVRFMAQTGG
ncbi:GTP 3',8-cyclase MoaA [Chitiniphilus purpureus]|uniref:GTP 3',8-cyclase n=1 Tax=Chitiniphilus purpureus TaxID=2981137 RepID=A0ABY6DNA7_9NEIS|nr:GTP 3',8-cyclase MoaA [Chitiniphilus sp. CD1]UXY15854.1 GTP 3',8-cyclase MoaA [Chitiniphilus sp. CD1]